MPTPATSTEPPCRFTAAVLAGGQSSRMGTDKAHLSHPGDSRSLLDHQFATLASLEPGPTQRIVAARVGQTLPPFPADVIRRDDDGAAGPLGAIARLLPHLTTPGLLVIPVDAPFIDAVTLQRLVTAFTDPRRSVVATTKDGGVQPLFAVYSQALAAAFGEALAGRRLGLRRFLESATVATSIDFIGFDDPLPFANWNTPEDRRA